MTSFLGGRKSGGGKDKGECNSRSPSGDDKQKVKSNGKGNRRFPFGDDKQKSNCNSKSKCDGKLATMGLKRFGIGFGDEHV